MSRESRRRFILCWVQYSDPDTSGRRHSRVTKVIPLGKAGIQNIRKLSQKYV